MGAELLRGGGSLEAVLFDSGAPLFSNKDEAFSRVDKYTSGGELVDIMIDQALVVFNLLAV
jgi:hypothetical protein